MAQGCNLPVSAEDMRRLGPSLRDPLGAGAILSAGRALEQRDAVAFARNVTYPLTNPDDPAHGVFLSALLSHVGGNEVISQSFRNSLPKALVMVAQQTPDVTGLVAPSHGKGATALRDNLAHRTRGDAFAYELLGTAELIRMNRVDHAGSKSTNGGPTLRIWDSDRLDLGVRLPAGARAHEGGIEGLFAPAGTGYAKFRRTFEADALLYRGDHVVGIDFKHARNDSSYASKTDDSWSQLQAVANGMMTRPDGLELREFHFVTNGIFEAGFVRAVDQINERLSRELGCEPPIGLHEKVQFPLR